MRTIKRLVSQCLGLVGYQLNRRTDPLATMKRLVTRPDPIIFDVGACVGGMALAFRRLYPEASIHCFEPHPDNLPPLRAATRDDSRVAVHELAVSDQEGSISFNANSAPATSSLLATNTDALVPWPAIRKFCETVRTIDVNTVTLDLFCQRHHIDRIDILKMDIQGAEYDALLGARSLLESRRIGLIYAEIVFMPAYVGQHPFHEYLSLLEGYGYVLYDIYEPTRLDNRLYYADALYVEEGLLLTGGA